jgi:hypothetical protein
MKIYGKSVAVEQLEQKKDETTKTRGLDMSAIYTKDLIKTKVVVDSDEFKVGTVVYFRSDVLAHNQNKNVLTLGSMKFVLFPVEWVVAYDRSESVEF